MLFFMSIEIYIPHSEVFESKDVSENVLSYRSMRADLVE